MDKIEVRKTIIDYLKNNNIYDALVVNPEKVMCLSELDTIMLHFNINSPGGVEINVKLYDDRMYVVAFYPDEIPKACKKTNSVSELRKVINFINSSIFIDELYYPRVFISDDGFLDIAMMTGIPYDFFEMAPMESCEYIVDYCPEFMERFAIPILNVVIGNKNAEQVIDSIRNDILSEIND